MASNLTVKENWITSFEMMVKRPIILLPFFIIAFLEGLALELIYFSTRKPLSLIAGPIIRKFSGEPSLHYPFNLVKLPKYLYYSQILIYIFIGVFLIAITVNIVKNIKGELPLRTNALIRNATKRYFSFIVFGIIMMGSIFLVQRLDTRVFSKLVLLLTKSFPHIAPKFYSLGFVLLSFISNIVLQTFLVLAIPIMVIRKKSLLRALAGSIGLGFRYFFSIFTLIFVPFMLYFPIALLKAYLPNMAAKTFPEINLWIVGIGVIATVFVECFIIVCASQFLLAREK